MGVNFPSYFVFVTMHSDNIEIDYVQMIKNTQSDTVKIVEEKMKAMERKIKNEMINQFYPVGSIYVSMDSTDPSILFGGRWTKIVDRFIYCSNSSKTTGGQSRIEVENLPDHTHECSIPKHRLVRHVTFTVASWDVDAFACESDGPDRQFSVKTCDTKGAYQTTFLPPYITAYAWYRIR